MKSNSVIQYEFNPKDLKRLSARIFNAGKTGQAAFKAATIVSLELVNKENQRRVKSQAWRYPQRRKPGFRDRAKLAGGYKVEIKPKRPADYIKGRAFYNYKHEEMRHAHLVDMGNGKGFAGYSLREKAFTATRKQAQGKFVKALRIAFEIAERHSQGKIPMKRLRKKLERK